MLCNVVSHQVRLSRLNNSHAARQKGCCVNKGKSAAMPFASLGNAAKVSMKHRGCPSANLAAMAELLCELHRTCMLEGYTAFSPVHVAHFENPFQQEQKVVVEASKGCMDVQALTPGNLWRADCHRRASMMGPGRPDASIARPST